MLRLCVSASGTGVGHCAGGTIPRSGRALPVLSLPLYLSARDLSSAKAMWMLEKAVADSPIPVLMIGST